MISLFFFSPFEIKWRAFDDTNRAMKTVYVSFIFWFPRLGEPRMPFMFWLPHSPEWGNQECPSYFDPPMRGNQECPLYPPWNFSGEFSAGEGEEGEGEGKKGGWQGCGGAAPAKRCTMFMIGRAATPSNEWDRTKNRGNCKAQKFKNSKMVRNGAQTVQNNATTTQNGCRFRHGGSVWLTSRLTSRPQIRRGAGAPAPLREEGWDWDWEGLAGVRGRSPRETVYSIYDSELFFRLCVSVSCSCGSRRKFWSCRERSRTTCPETADHTGVDPTKSQSWTPRQTKSIHQQFQMQDFHLIWWKKLKTRVCVQQDVASLLNSNVTHYIKSNMFLQVQNMCRVAIESGRQYF